MLDLIKSLEGAYVKGDISHKTYFRLLGVLHGDQPLTDYLEKDYDFSLDDLERLSKNEKEYQSNHNESIAFGNTHENIVIHQLLEEEYLRDIEVKHQIFQSQMTGNFFLEIERETGLDTYEYEISPTGVKGNSKNFLIKYDSIDTEDNTIITFNILVNREDLLKRIKRLHCPVVTSIKQNRRTRGYTIPISQLLFDWDIDRPMAIEKETRYSNKVTKNRG